eukprot:364886-Chlamydomonas_euryale.AAC.7
MGGKKGKKGVGHICPPMTRLGARGFWFGAGRGPQGGPAWQRLTENNNKDRLTGFKKDTCTEPQQNEQAHKPQSCHARLGYLHALGCGCCYSCYPTLPSSPPAIDTQLDAPFAHARAVTIIAIPPPPTTIFPPPAEQPDARYDPGPHLPPHLPQLPN